ncbi:MAG: hypothetical protein ACYSSP_13695 [Planctomycetota bacterium]|jgi:uncharacterized membrane protein YdjX (TVP38/TMEM64 family)
MKEFLKKFLIAAAIGAVVGAVIYAIIGGVGVAATGTAVGTNLIQFIFIGALAGMVVYIPYCIGKKVGKNEAKK